MPYALLEEGASYADWSTACRAISSVSFTTEDLKAGFYILASGDLSGEKMRAFTARYQDVEPALVTASLCSRYEIFCEAQDLGVDLQADHFDVFQSLATKALTPEDFYVFDAHEA